MKVNSLTIHYDSQNVPKMVTFNGERFETKPGTPVIVADVIKARKFGAFTQLTLDGPVEVKLIEPTKAEKEALQPKKMGKRGYK